MQICETMYHILNNLLSGLGGVVVGALITYFSQKSINIKKEKTALVDEFLKRPYQYNSELYCLLTRVKLIFQSKEINKKVDIIFYKNYTNTLKEKIAELIKLMCDDIGYRKVTDAFIKDVLEKN